MAGKSGGAWKVAYADFVTAMMAFFMVMWITAQSKQVKESVAKYFQDPYGGTSSMPSGNAFRKAEDDQEGPYVKGRPRSGPGNGRSIGARGKPNHDPQASPANQPSVFVLHGGGRSSVGTVLYFSQYAADLDESATEQMMELLPLVVGKRNKIEIRGHATGRPLPANQPYADAWELCYARCTATMQFLNEHGVPKDRVRLSQAGPHEPQSIAGVSGGNKLAQNSRVEVYMLTESVEQFRGDQKQRDKMLDSEDEPAEEATSEGGEGEHGEHGEGHVIPAGEMDEHEKSDAHGESHSIDTHH